MKKNLLLSCSFISLLQAASRSSEPAVITLHHAFEEHIINNASPESSSSAEQAFFEEREAEAFAQFDDFLNEDFTLEDIGIETPVIQELTRFQEIISWIKNKAVSVVLKYYALKVWALQSLKNSSMNTLYEK